MKRATYSIPVGIACIACTCLLSAACVNNQGLDFIRADARSPDGGGRGGTSTAQGGRSGTLGTAGSAGVRTAASSTGGQAGASNQGGTTAPVNTGGVPGTRATGSGGATGNGGSRGGADAGANTGKTDAGTFSTAPDVKPDKDTGKPDTADRRDSSMNCGPVCAIYCQYGNVLDSNGCPTCSCNPAPIECPAIKCKACPFGYLEDENGCQTCTCATDPSLPCNLLLDLPSCKGSTKCRWLEPGCGTPALAAAGCYDRTAVGCLASTDCKDFRTCIQRSINPCVNADCNACGVMTGICL